MKMSCDCQPKHPQPRKLKCCPGVEIDYIEIPVSAGTDEPGQPLAPENGAHKNAVVRYAANSHVYIYTSEGIPVMLSDGGDDAVLSVNGKTGEVVLKTSDLENDSGYQTSSDVETIVGEEVLARIEADNGLQQQIDAISASSDVTDIVGTYNDLERYDTSKLNDNDIIKVLQDESHDNETTYYRWDKETETFTLIGEEGPYYTKSAADQKFQNKLTAGTNITIDPLTDTISASVDAETIFYANLSETGTNRHIYKEISFATAVSAQELIDANNKGQVILRGTTTVNPTAYSDAYLQNAFIMPHNNDFEFVFLDRDLRHEYTASDTADTAFYYYTSEIQPKLTAGANINISGTTISATDTTYSDMVGATTSAAGTHGLAPAPVAGSPERSLKADGSWGMTRVTTGVENLDVSSDTPSGWHTAIMNALSIPDSTGVYEVNIRYYSDGHFSSQPAALGNLQVFLIGHTPVLQLWTTLYTGEFYQRVGGPNGWDSPGWTRIIRAKDSGIVTTSMLAAGAATTAKIDDGAVTRAKFGSGAEIVGATSSANGERGVAPAPSAGEEGEFLRGDGTWASPPTASDSTYGQIKSSASTIKLITQADFTALATKDPNTLYLVRENPSV